MREVAKRTRSPFPPPGYGSFCASIGIPEPSNDRSRLFDVLRTVVKILLPHECKFRFVREDQMTYRTKAGETALYTAERGTPEAELPYFSPALRFEVFFPDSLPIPDLANLIRRSVMDQPADRTTDTLKLIADLLEGKGCTKSQDF